MSDDALKRYLDRVGLAGPPPVSAEALAIVQAAQRIAIPFENLDIPLGRGIDLDRAAIFDKLVMHARGGYCFEQNSLFADMLGLLGFAVRPLLARVQIGQSGGEITPRTHQMLVVTLEGDLWIADAGFGSAYMPPMRLEDDFTVSGADGVPHRLTRQGAPGSLPGEWRLERAAVDGSAPWQPLYSFDLAEIAPVDLAQANYWTSTRAGSRFTDLRIVSIALPDGFASLTEKTLKVTRGSVMEEREITDVSDYRSVLVRQFRLELTDSEVNALGLF